jgi:branched-chain amino acid transport system ATP-binding protein
MLKLDNVTAGYGKVDVLRGVSIEVNAGEIVTIIGANGAGKTTTLKTLCGVVPARSGSIQFEGQELVGKSSHDIVELGVTMIPEERQLFPFMSVEDNLLMGAFKHSARRERRKRMDEVLGMFPVVRERLAQRAASLSGGEQQMVAIARGMMAKPKLLVFDEPSLGLSPLLVEKVFGIVRTVAESGVTVLLVEQDVFDTLQIVDRGYVLENGSVALAGTGAELMENPHVRRAYLGL